MSNITIVFDLDDTLVKEIDFLKSAFFEIASAIESDGYSLYNQMMVWYLEKENVFQKLVHLYPDLNIDSLKIKYRNHLPNFEEYSYIKDFLIELKQKEYKLGLITDGYSVTQRNKIKSLGLENVFDLIIISEEFGFEKPCEENYKVFHQFNSDFYYYIGDNFNKDFVAPNNLNWITIGLVNDGKNIHTQDFSMHESFLPKIFINHIYETNNIF
jgi:putative hydrolase of the HAD superfamily